MWTLSIVVILLIVILVLYILSNLRAREWAIFHASNLCKQYNVQLLDSSIVQTSLKISRDKDGKLCWQRSYSFEYSSDGLSRDIGKVILHANKLCHISIFDDNSSTENDSETTSVDNEYNSDTESPASNDNVVKISSFRNKDKE
jgi:hypothetical protein